MVEFSAIILAAGLSRRMGASNKLMIPIEGQKMIRKSVMPYIEFCDGDVVVVTGYQSERVEEALDGLAARCIFNPRYEEGQKTSVAAGLGAVGDAKFCFIGLGDQPFLTHDDLKGLAAMRRAGKVLLPVDNDNRGNPLLIPQALKQSLLSDRANPGCQTFTRENPDKVERVSGLSPAFFHDLDTPEAINALQTGKEPIICAL